MNDTKFNIKKCRTCIYRGTVSGGVKSSAKGIRINNVCCYYASNTGNTCLKRTNSNTLNDIRGNDYENCKLYKKGNAIRNQDCMVPRGSQKKC